jgi:small-conductance mechanosensitive channel
VQGLTTTATYGRKVLVPVAAFAILSLEIASGASTLTALLTLSAQLSAVFFGGAPGSMTWLLLSRKPAELASIRRWDGAAKAFILATCLGYFAFADQLSTRFLGLSGALLFFIYFGAKQGCYQLGCCGWSMQTTQFAHLRSRIALQKLEALLAVIAGFGILYLATWSSAKQELVWIAAVALHVAMRRVFATVRDHSPLVVI